MSDYFNLPQHLFAEILVRLPIKDVVKSTAVCKSWNSLIKNPTFISSHLEKTISFNNSTNTHLLLFRICPEESLFQKQYAADRVAENYSLRYDNEEVDEYQQLHLPTNVESFTGCFRVAGSINGLVCLVDDMKSYVNNCFLWNPVIKKVVRVPDPGVTFWSHGGFDAYTGFGFDSKRNDYKLLRFVQLLDYHLYLPHDNDADSSSSKETMVEVEIYSLNANCWRSITPVAPKYGLCPGTLRTYGNSFVNGAIHMLAEDKDRNLILAFDVSEEVFREISLPDCLSHGYMNLRCTELLTYSQSIAAMTCDWEGTDGYRNNVRQTHLWVMKEYGVAMSWTKVFTELAQFVPRVLFFRKKEEQVFMTLDRGWIGSIDIKKKQGKVFGVRSVDSLKGYPVIDGFVESLVLLDKAKVCWDGIVSNEDSQAVDGDSNEKGAPENDSSSVDDEYPQEDGKSVDADSNEEGAPENDASSVDDEYPQEDGKSADGDSNEGGAPEKDASSVDDEYPQEDGKSVAADSNEEGAPENDAGSVDDDSDDSSSADDDLDENVAIPRCNIC